MMNLKKRPARDTVSAVIISATREMIATSGKSLATFATEDLIPALELNELVDMGSEGVNVEDYIRWRQRCIKRAQRIVLDEVPMPADWIIVWTSVLSEPYRQKAQRKIAAMHGLQWVQIPRYNRVRASSVEAEIPAITSAFGDVLMHSSPAHDGVYDEHDNLGAVRALQNRLYCLLNHLQREMINIETATGIAPDAVEAGRNSPLINGGPHAAA